MEFLSNKFATFVDVINGQKFIIKSMDFYNDREPVLCFREYFGYKIGRALGLFIPPTILTIIPTYGRVSMQIYVEGCRHITDSEKKYLARTPLGNRILIFDLLTRNHDRRNENVLVNDRNIFPIDFNVAFNLSEKENTFSAFKNISMSWFGLHNIVGLKKTDLFAFLDEAYYAQDIITDEFIVCLIKSVDERFCGAEKIKKVAYNLRKNRQLIPYFLQIFWEKVVLPDVYRMEVNKYYENRKKNCIYEA